MSQTLSLEIASDSVGGTDSTAENIFRDVKSIVNLAMRRLLAISITAGVIFLAIAYLTFTQTPTYQATATVIKDSEQSNVIDLGAVLNGAGLSTAAIDTEVRVMTSKALLAKVAVTEKLREEPEFNPTLLPPPEPGFLDKILGRDAPEEPAVALTDEEIDEIVLDNLMARIGVGRVGTTYLMDVTATSTSPEMAARLANAVARQYGLEQLETKLEATERATRWLSERVDVLQDEVRAKEILVEDFRASSGLLSAQGATLTESNIAMLQTQRVELERDVAQVRARYNSMRRQMERGATGVAALSEVLDSPVITQLKNQLADARRRVAQLETDLGDRHPDLRAARNEVTDFENQIEAEVNRIIENLQVEVEVAEDQIAGIDRRIAIARSNLTRNNSSQVRLNDLERDAEASRAILEEFVSRFKETREQDGLIEPDARVLSEASVPAGPASPKKLLNLIIGMMLGGCCGFGLAIVLEVFNNKISNVEDIERKFGVPSIGAIPLIRTLRFLGFGSKIPADFLVNNPLSAYAESMRFMRASIAIAAMEDKTKTVTIASSLPDEGKTSLTLSLGRMAALSGERTLVIDGDFRRRQLTESAGLTPETGLVEYLLGECTLEQTIYREEDTNLDLLALTINGRQLHDVFGSRKFDALLDELKQSYDLILIDTAPLLLMAEAGVIASKTDKTILVVRWMRSRRSAVRRSLDMLKGMRAEVLGVALNMVDLTRRRHHSEESANNSAYRKYYTTEPRLEWLRWKKKKSNVVPSTPAVEENSNDNYDSSFSQMKSMLNKKS